MVDVVVLLDGALLVLDDALGAGLEVVAHQGLVGVVGGKVLEVAAELVAGAGLLALALIPHEGAHVDGVLPVGKRRLSYR